MISVTYPSYPSPAGPGNRAAQPGWYPLRPLTIGEVIGAGLRVASRHLAVLAPVAFVVSVIASAANLLVLAANGSLRAFADGDLTRVPVGGGAEQTNEYLHNYFSQVLPALGLSTLLSLIFAPMLAGVAAPFAAQAATTRTGSNADGLARLRSRIPTLLVLGVVVGVATAVGYVLLIVPGVIIALILLPAGPVAAMESLGVSDSIGRASKLSKGFKGRLFGVNLLMVLIVGAIGLVITSILQRAVGGDDPVIRLIVLQLLSAVVAAVLTPWSSAVTAMLYIDLRMRREGLAKALLASIGPAY